MAQKSVLLDKSLLFAARIIKLHQYLTKEEKEIAETEYWLRLDLTVSNIFAIS